MKKKTLLLAAVLATGSFVFAQEKSPPPAPPPPPKVELVKFLPPQELDVKVAEEFYSRNNEVKKVTYFGHNRIKIVRKDKTVEHFDLQKTGDKKKFEAKYGEVPPPNAPPPPPPPAPPAEA